MIAVDDSVFSLWMFCVELLALQEDRDIKHVPECVWRHYAAQDFSVRQALEAACQ